MTLYQWQNSYPDTSKHPHYLKHHNYLNSAASHHFIKLSPFNPIKMVKRERSSSSSRAGNESKRHHGDGRKERRRHEREVYRPTSTDQPRTLTSTSQAQATSSNHHDSLRDRASTSAPAQRAGGAAKSQKMGTSSRGELVNNLNNHNAICCKCRGSTWMVISASEVACNEPNCPGDGPHRKHKQCVNCSENLPCRYSWGVCWVGLCWYLWWGWCSAVVAQGTGRIERAGLRA